MEAVKPAGCTGVWGRCWGIVKFPEVACDKDEGGGGGGVGGVNDFSGSSESLMSVEGGFCDVFCNFNMNINRLKLLIGIGSHAMQANLHYCAHLPDL